MSDLLSSAQPFRRNRQAEAWGCGALEPSSSSAAHQHLLALTCAAIPPCPEGVGLGHGGAVCGTAGAASVPRFHEDRQPELLGSAHGAGGVGALASLAQGCPGAPPAPFSHPAPQLRGQLPHSTQQDGHPVPKPGQGHWRSCQCHQLSHGVVVLWSCCCKRQRGDMPVCASLLGDDGNGSRAPSPPPSTAVAPVGLSQLLSLPQSARTGHWMHPHARAIACFGECQEGP